MPYYLLSTSQKIDLINKIDFLISRLTAREDRPGAISQLVSLSSNIKADILLLSDISPFATLTVLSNGNNIVNQHAPLDSGEYSLVAIKEFEISQILH